MKNIFIVIIKIKMAVTWDGCGTRRRYYNILVVTLLTACKAIAIIRLKLFPNCIAPCIWNITNQISRQLYYGKQNMRG